MQTKSNTEVLKEVLKEEIDNYKKVVIDGKINSYLYTIHTISYLRTFLYTHGFVDLDIKEFMTELLVDFDSEKE